MATHAFIKPKNALLPLTLTLVGYADSSSPHISVTCPGGVQAGDLLVMLDASRNGGTSLPSGFTLNYTYSKNIASNPYRFTHCWKVADGTEGGTSIGGMGAGITADAATKCIWVFRGNRPISPPTVTVGTNAAYFQDVSAGNSPPSSNMTRIDYASVQSAGQNVVGLIVTSFWALRPAGIRVDNCIVSPVFTPGSNVAQITNQATNNKFCTKIVIFDSNNPGYDNVYTSIGQETTQYNFAMRSCLGFFENQ